MEITTYFKVTSHHQVLVIVIKTSDVLKGLAHAKIIKKSVILFRALNMTIWCKHVHRLELQIFIIFVLRIHQLG